MSEERCDPLCCDAPRAEEIREGWQEGDAVRSGDGLALSDPGWPMLAAALREDLCDLGELSA